jgi:hypothetical protein
MKYHLKIVLGPRFYGRILHRRRSWQHLNMLLTTMHAKSLKCLCIHSLPDKCGVWNRRIDVNHTPQQGGQMSLLKIAQNVAQDMFCQN